MVSSKSLQCIGGSRFFAEGARASNGKELVFEEKFNLHGPMKGVQLSHGAIIKRDLYSTQPISTKTATQVFVKK
jgi:hypothetical protein